MVSSTSTASSGIEQLMMSMYQKMSAADTDGITGLSKNELSSIDTGSDTGGTAFLKALTDKFDSLDTDGNGELSASEISAAKPHHMGHMGPPPGMDLGSTDSANQADAVDSTTSADSTGSTNSNNPISAIENWIETMLENLLASLQNGADSTTSDAQSAANSNTSATDTSTAPIDTLSSADTDGKTGLSINELSSIDTGNDSGRANFINDLVKNFDSYDADGDGQLSHSEIKAAISQHFSQQTAAASDNNSLNGFGSTLGSLSSSFIQKMISNYQGSNLSNIASSLSIAG